jgi:adenylosuccinate synthase
MPGWQAEIGSARSWADLPSECRAYVERIEEEVGAPIDLIGVGPRRDQFVVRREQAYFS